MNDFNANDLSQYWDSETKKEVEEFKAKGLAWCVRGENPWDSDDPAEWEYSAHCMDADLALHYMQHGGGIWNYVIPDVD